LEGNALGNGRDFINDNYCYDLCVTIARTKYIPDKGKFYSSEQNRQKKQSEGVRFCQLATQNTVPYCQNTSLIDCFFGNFAHWDHYHFVFTKIY